MTEQTITTERAAALRRYCDRMKQAAEDPVTIALRQAEDELRACAIAAEEADSPTAWIAYLHAAEVVAEQNREHGEAIYGDARRAWEQA